MHLFAAKPGGFVDDEGIVDLQQSPSDVVILSAADSNLSALAQAADRLGEAYPSLRLANWMNLAKPAAFDLYEHKVLEHAKVVVVSLLGGKGYWQYGFERLLAWQAAGTERALIVVPGCDAPDDALLRESSVSFDDAYRVWRFLREGGVDNAEQLLRFIAANCMPQSLENFSWQEPRVVPPAVIYAPQGAQASGSLHEWRKTRGDGPTCLLVFYRSHLQGGNTGVVDGMLEALEAEGLSPLAVAVASLKERACIEFVNHLIEATGAGLLINTTSFSVNRNSDEADTESVTVAPDESLFTGQPVVLQAMLASSTVEDWAASSAGLRARDVAMQIVLPEMDGRVITRAVGFKAEAHFNERCQLSITHHGVNRERAAFVAQLARRTLGLRETPNAQKRVALIMANYPNRDGRIGNGVGLDTPASTLNILTALAQAGYPVADIPESGDALIGLLQGSITNDHAGLDRGCWQSIGVDAYLAWFETLPERLRAAVTTRWGAPQDDPKYRQGRLMIAGVRLGETFVGIQPERDFADDLTQSYHDMELAPPHSYLAFYLWLREHYGVEAVVHVGKHGSLEWLPGKSTALSSECWPEIALGPLPHFYPFIVNDPGEGAQAKRRSQAVIIDHLMPPLARAELYGPMAELEALTDEYYQALDMDPRREALIRSQILKHLRDSGIDQELAQGGEYGGHCDAELLSELDTFLCDIKESQIRHGLHVLGTNPPVEKRAGTLVALLRLPRGNAVVRRSLLQNLADDLSLEIDPLAAGSEAWTGPTPAVLKALLASPWRSGADTRERLELLAEQLVSAYVLQDGCLEALSHDYPATAEQLAFGRTLWATLQRGVTMELGSLIAGLEGRFVPAGPSGAPSRGRLDTLPTGRNFFSVDNRSIPSPAAWQLGEKSAQAFVERYLQDHGDYPRRLGLSIWGTATMRTGGDDIAQAFALMGVRPKWSLGSQRVIDFEVIPAMLLNRPRVDVTLRVSGFFRDAFPNVIRLFDAAVQAVADYNEPGNSNTIRQAVLARTAELKAQGLDDGDASEQARYRIFGSKPGEYGAGLNRLIENRSWESADDLAEAYLRTGAYAYGQFENAGTPARAAFEQQVKGLDAVMHNQDNREHDLLDSNSYYAFQGGLANASRALSGEQPTIYHADHANPAMPTIRTLKEELGKVIRSRVLNPKWIEAMREHGYKGAFEMAATIDYLFAYDATTDLIADYQYAQVSQALVLDETNQQFLREHNPAALDEMAERLMEAVQRGMWQAPGEQAEKLSELLLEMDEAKERGGR
ncbi:cobaltochelatase subunit CobN [Vreelandella sp. GE22]